MVQVASDLKLKNPFVVVRWHSGIDGGFFEQVCTAMRDNATVIVYNDDQMIPALRQCGVEEPEIYDYGFFGCNDPIIPAEEGGLRQLWLNLVKPLELALNEGDYPMEPGGTNRDLYVFPLEDRLTGLMTGAYYGAKTLPLDKMTSMEDVLGAYREQLRFLMRSYRQGIERDMELEKRVNAGRLRFEDCFLRGTLENAITWNNGGTKYHYIVVQGSGIATAADALYAIDHLVFQEKAYTLPQLNGILTSDWEGQEALRQRILHLPKFGNDADEVDQYAAWVGEAFADAVSEQDQGRYLYGFLPTLSSDRDFTTMGRCVGATADGRVCRAPISENQSPAEGADLSGVTALLNSVSKIRFDRITGGPLNLRLHPSAVQGEKGAHLLTALLTTYFQKGGLQIQMNVVDRDTLIRAQQEPEKYRNLCVRVTGYSAFFTQMGRRAQDEMIRRTEQSF
jgi:formate C-acetyltransferase